MAALVPGPGPVADLVAAPAVLREAHDRVVVHRRRPIVVLGRPRLLAPAAGPAARRQVVPVRPGEALGVGVVEGQRVEREVVRRERQRLVERDHPGRDRLVRDVVQQVEADRADARLRVPRRRPRRRPRGDDGGPSRRSSLGIPLWAPSDSRVTPGAMLGGGVAALVGPGLASSVTSAPGASPNRSRTRSMSAARSSGGRSDGVPPPRYERIEGRAAGATGGPNAASSASARRAISDRRAARNAAIRFVGPARLGPGDDDEVAVRAERDAERDVDVQRDGASRRDRRYRRLDRTTGRAGHRSLLGRVADADDVPAIGRGLALRDVLGLARRAGAAGRHGPSRGRPRGG